MLVGKISKKLESRHKKCIEMNTTSKLFKNLNLKSLKINDLESVNGGLVQQSVNYITSNLGNKTFSTGDTDSTGDYLSADCGDGSQNHTDSRPALPTERYYFSNSNY